MIGLMGKGYWLVMKVVECVLVNLSVSDLLGMKKGEVVFEVHFCEGNEAVESICCGGNASWKDEGCICCCC